MGIVTEAPTFQEDIGLRAWATEVALARAAFTSPDVTGLCVGTTGVAPDETIGLECEVGLPPTEGHCVSIGLAAPHASRDDQTPLCGHKYTRPIWCIFQLGTSA